MTPIQTIVGHLASLEPLASSTDAKRELEDAAKAIDDELQYLRQEVIRLSNPGAR